MKSLTAYLLIFSVFYLLSCKSNEVFLPSESAQNYIMLGNGGGFTGKTTTYYILENGSVYRALEFKNDFSYLGKIKKQIVTQQWNTYKSLNLKNRKINEPGNMYFFMDFKFEDHSNKMIWGKESNNFNGVIETMYLILFREIKSLNQEVKKLSIK